MPPRSHTYGLCLGVWSCVRDAHTDSATPLVTAEWMESPCVYPGDSDIPKTPVNLGWVKATVGHEGRGGHTPALGDSGNTPHTNSYGF